MTKDRSQCRKSTLAPSSRSHLISIDSSFLIFLVSTAFLLLYCSAFVCFRQWFWPFARAFHKCPNFAVKAKNSLFSATIPETHIVFWLNSACLSSLVFPDKSYHNEHLSSPRLVFAVQWKTWGIGNRRIFYPS
jgi:hypothetical protein